MRLIDADELIEYIQGSDELLDSKKDECIECINDCDTAYDMDKVVNEIKELSIREFGEIRTEDVIRIVKQENAELLENK